MIVSFIIANMDNGTCPASPMRADDFLYQGNLLRITQTIEELQRERPRDGEAVH